LKRRIGLSSPGLPRRPRLLSTAPSGLHPKVIWLKLTGNFSKNWPIPHKIHKQIQAPTIKFPVFIKTGNLSMETVIIDSKKRFWPKNMEKFLRHFDQNIYYHQILLLKTIFQDPHQATLPSALRAAPLRSLSIPVKFL
jgi:hypothetical protein